MTVGDRDVETIDFYEGLDYRGKEVVRINVSEDISLNNTDTTGSALKLIDRLINLPELPDALPGADEDGAPPKPLLGVCKALVDNSLTLVWHMGNHSTPLQELRRFELWTCAKPCNRWKKVGDIRAMVLPMSATLSNIPDNMQFYAIRAVGVNGRFGLFSNPCGFTLNSQ